VLQRSLHEAAVDVPAIPATIQPGDTVDWPIPISGFVQVDAVEAEGLPIGDPPAPSKTARKKSAPEPAPVGEEPQP
jgi:hypothetical protein